jgi:hypothetical protein
LSDADAWRKWNLIRTLSNHAGLLVSIEITKNVSMEEISRWIAEPVSAITMNTDIFVQNSKQYPVLKKEHQNIIHQLMKVNLSFLKLCILNNFPKAQYSDYYSMQ